MNWGIGHATRMIPLIHELKKNKIDVVIASSGRGQKILIEEFPALEHETINTLNLNFNSIFSIKWQIIFKCFKIFKQIKRESLELDSLILKHKLSAVISDNLYGYHSKKIKSIIVTHQLNLPPKTPFSIFANRKIKSYLQNFDEIWVPDLSDSLLTGKLTNDFKLKKLKFIGPLSRFSKKESKKREDFILILASGTEPQRTLFENKIIKTFNGTQIPIKFLRGVSESDQKKVFPKSFEVHNHLNSKELEKLMLSCKCLISRSGYSTIMDACITNTPAIWIPTKGQPEQEYLAKHLKEKKGVTICNLKKLKQTDIDKAKPIQLNLNSELEKAILEFINSLQS